MKKALSLVLALVMLISLVPQVVLNVRAEQACTSHSYVGGVCQICGSSVLGADWMAPEFADGDYAMAVLPDTQNLVQRYPQVYYNQMQWIADHKDSLNIQAVMNMGDMVNINNDTQWKICKNGTEILQNAGIPWMPMMGNHDDAAWFNKYYDYTTYGSQQSWFGGSYYADKLDHTYWFVTVGDREYMILSLGWAPNWDVLAWAQNAVEANPKKNVILNCHAYMNSDGTLLSKGDDHCVSSYLSGYPNGDDVWNAFKGYENVVLAMGGHIYSPDVVTFVDQNGIGRDVTSLLIDRQDEDNTKQLGMVAILIFHNDSNQVDINWYSTRYDALYREKNQFAISVPHVCDHRFTTSVAAANCTEGGGLKYTCTLCGYAYLEAETAPLGHDYDVVVTAPSCATEGYSTLVCSICGYSERQQTITDITDQFVWLEGVRITATNGQQVVDSNWIASDYLDISTYQSIEIKTANTASKDSNAGLAFYDANKNYISGVIHTNKSGLYGTLIRDLEIPENAVYVRTTWYSQNHASYDPAFGEAYCKAVVSTIPALPHDYHTENVAPTCTTPGYIANVCSACGHTERTAFATDITNQFQWSEGYVISAVNGNKMVDRNWVASDYVDVSGYVSIEMVTGDTVNANTTLGIAFYDASFKYISGVLHTDKVGDTYGILVHNLKIPSNAVYVRSTWYSVNHDKYNGATIHTFYCKGYVEEIPTIDHVYMPVVTAPTCTEQGYTTYTCACGDSYVGDYTDATGHSYVNSLCAACGKADPDYWGTWVAFGTSITEDKDYMRPNATNIKGTYIPYLSELMGVEAPDANYSIGGAAFSTHLLMYMYYAKYQKTGLTYNGYTHTAIKNANLITIEGGVNDFVGNVPLGKLGDTIPYSKADPISVNPNSTNNFGGTTEGTFAGCIYAAITELRRVAPNAMIVFITDNAGTGSCAATKANKLGYYLHDYNDMMTAIAESMGCYVIDAGRTAGFEENLKAYLYDHIHHSEAGGEAYANAIWDGLCAIANGEQTKHSHTHKYEDNMCIFCGDIIGPVIAQQPESVQQEIGKKFAITVKAEGEGLTYQWYYKDAGMKEFKISSNKTSSYAYTMQTYMHNRQVYCVITDANGNQVMTDVATITRPPMELTLIAQPQSVQTAIGEKFSVKPTVQGDGLTYQWYYKDAGMKEFKISSNRTSAYAYTMQSYMHNRQVYCVITDAYGNSVTTEVATITRPPMELKLLSQTLSVSAALGEKFSVSVNAQGDGLTYQWYYKESYQKTFSASSNKSSAYAYAMQSYMNGRQVYCVITDQYGNQITTEVVTLTLR